MSGERVCAQCRAELPPRRSYMGPAPVYCGVRCRRVREYARARARRRQRRAAYAAELAAQGFSVLGWGVGAGEAVSGAESDAETPDTAVREQR